MAKPIPKNVTAQLAHRVRGNPPTAHLESSVSNCYPGLEFDLRGMWGKIFKEVILHETRNAVMAIEEGFETDFGALQGLLLWRATHSVLGEIAIRYRYGSRSAAVERGNAMADLISRYGGTKVECHFHLLPVVSDTSSTLSNNAGEEIFPGVGSLDLNPFSIWLSARQAASDAAQFIEWDFGRDVSLRGIDVHPPAGRLAALAPEKFNLSVRSSSDSGFTPVGTEENGLRNDFDDWLSFRLGDTHVRFIRMEITELAEFNPGEFYAAVGDVDFDVGEEIVKTLTVREFFLRPGPSNSLEERVLSVSGDELKPGELTQSLCAPWIHDYRDCWCVYWAASRPDIVNVDDEGRGDNWTDTARSGTPGPPDYRTTPGGGSILFSYEELFNSWGDKKILKFQIDGKDEV